ncbi:hypothetical protein GN277_28575 (plasmid) [Lachnospiraceae bacterium WCA-9-b2]|uniref:Schlafen AlbA-2 domain-containing protein n=1 Tax=Sporofaciens musculi TaxID=2681861 RepID=A0A7X3MMG7_9FIRM|nr:ATP-binding protein [Sporofaciens musculi]MXP79116.1 hypothetical protein [Sporofaciens musculi]
MGNWLSYGVVGNAVCRTWESRTFEEESFYFEFKSDQVNTKKMLEEISALANTYGGYIFLGVSDDKKIYGCTKWTEQRIHTLIHDALSPAPNFDVKKFITDDERTIFVIKVEEGPTPPYITNSGKIYERLSSGSFLVNDSTRLSQMYYKREHELSRIEKKLAISPINSFPNLFGYLDIGFSLRTTNNDSVWEQFINADLKQLSHSLEDPNNKHSISRVGHSIVFSVGEVTNPNNIVEANLHNFMEIIGDGSVKLRILLTNNAGKSKVNIACIISILSIFRKIYSQIFETDFSEIFIGAYKYENLTVLNQFTPFIEFDGESSNLNNEWANYYHQHIMNYGNNLIITSDRIPKYGFNFLDKKYFNSIEKNITSENIIEELFSSSFTFLGYIFPLND